VANWKHFGWMEEELAQEIKEEEEQGQEEQGQEKPPESQPQAIIPYQEPAQEDQDDQDDQDDDQDDEQPEGPVLHPAAYYGLLGAMVREIEKEIEPHPINVLLPSLAIFGGIVGRGAWFPVDETVHFPWLFVGMVGRSSDRKGQGWAKAVWPYEQPIVAKAWTEQCIAHGVGTAEGLIERLCDISGMPDTVQCLVRLGELSTLVKKGRRGGSALSEYVREMFDARPIEIMNRYRTLLRASNYSLTICGDIQPDMIRKVLRTGTEGYDGWACRFLWPLVRRQRFIPEGGDISALNPYLLPLRRALEFGREAGEMHRSPNAKALWKEIYPALSTSGEKILHTERSDVHVLRLSMIYALADHSAMITEQHLAAALAVVAYCRESAKILFGEVQQVQGKAKEGWQEVYEVIKANPGINRKGLHEKFANRMRAEVLNDALEYLERTGRVRREKYKPAGGGRAGERWYAN
jgi:hypothetical protein